MAGRRRGVVGNRWPGTGTLLRCAPAAVASFLCVCRTSVIDSPVSYTGSKGTSCLLFERRLERRRIAYTDGNRLFDAITATTKQVSAPWATKLHARSNFEDVLIHDLDRIRTQKLVNSSSIIR
ncbi:Protein of unknown function [Gryllus bimaculatus]|nr:Protein of unknown function [Gryllus bimaculatus]